MPVAVLTAQEQTEAINTLDSTLSEILEEKKVRRDVQAALAKLEIQYCETFALMEGAVEKFREWLQSTDIGLEGQGADGGSVGGGSRENQHTTTARSRTTCCRPSCCHSREVFVTMRRAWEANLEANQTLSQSELPAKSFLEWCIAQWTTTSFSSSHSRKSQANKRSQHKQTTRRRPILYEKAAKR